MARGSKKNTAQSNSAKGASAQRKKGKNNAEERVALKDAPSRGRARARAVEEEAPFEEIDREPRIFDDRTKRDIAGVIVAVLAVEGKGNISGGGESLSFSAGDCFFVPAKTGECRITGEAVCIFVTV